MIDPNKLHPLHLQSSNVVFLKNVITNPNIKVGDYTYYDGRGRGDFFENERVLFAHTTHLTIGKFCQLAYETTFILSDANHQMDGFSTFPFYVYGMYGDDPEWKNYNCKFPTEGDTIVGNDVWFGHKSMIMPRVKIGDGAIIGTRSLVTQDVAPYTIVAGHPAKVIRQRFSDKVIDKLQKIQWWNWDYKTITNNLDAITGGDINKLERVNNND